MDTSLVGKCAETGDVVVASDIESALRRVRDLSHSQGHRDLHRLCDEVLDLTQHGKFVFALDVFRVGDHHTRDKATKGCDPIPFSDTKL